MAGHNTAQANGHSPGCHCYHLPWVSLFKPCLSLCTLLGLVHYSCQERGQRRHLCALLTENGAQPTRDFADEQLLLSNWRRATESTICMIICGLLRLRSVFLFLHSLSCPFPFPLCQNNTFLHILQAVCFFQLDFFFWTFKSHSSISINLLFFHISSRISPPLSPKNVLLLSQC